MRRAIAFFAASPPRRWLRFTVTSVVAMMLVGWVGASAASATPSNDDFADATVITSLPFSEVVDVAGSTLEPGEPPPCGSFQLGTLWYSFTPATTQVVQVDNYGGIPGATNVFAQTGTGFAGLTPVGCGQTVSVVFTAQAGTTYYFQSGLPFYTSSGNLAINVTAPAPPSNDDFANAAAVTLPVYAPVDTTAATREMGEPTPACASNATGSAWYSFTPGVSETVSANTSSFFGSSVVALYTGTSLANLTEVGSSCGGTLTTHVDSGTTYFVQASGIYGGQGTLTVSVAPTPPPYVAFQYDPSFEPSPRDVVTFYNVSSDSTGLGFQPASWDFGDGTKVTSDSYSVTHQYAKDGDYTVTLTATTTDGRSGTSQQVLHVQTHDVSITKLNVPDAGKLGQTKSVTVVVKNAGRYPETVRVDLYVAVGGGFQQVASLTEPLDAKGAKQPASFVFAYTFTSSDAAAKKVVFRADAVLMNHRDVFPGDNSVVSPAVKVKA